MTYHSVDGMRYHITEYGSGEPLVLLHGFTGSAKNWQDLMQTFSTQFHVVAVDLPGHGLTDAPDDVARYEMARVAGDLAVLIRKLVSSPINLLGYSMGGRLALFMAIHQPELIRSAILESASPGIVNKIERDSRRIQDEALAARIESDGIPDFVEYWESLPLFSTHQQLPGRALEMLREQRLANSARGLAHSLRGMGAGAQPSLWNQLDTLALPVLLIAGELDEKFTAINRQMAAGIPGAQLELIPRTGHTVHLEQPKIFTGVVMGFLAEASENNGQNLTGAKQDDKNKSRQ